MSLKVIGIIQNAVVAPSLVSIFINIILVKKRKKVLSRAVLAIAWLSPLSGKKMFSKLVVI